MRKYPVQAMSVALALRSQSKYDAQFVIIVAPLASVLAASQVILALADVE